MSEKKSVLISNMVERIDVTDAPTHPLYEAQKMCRTGVLLPGAEQHS